MILEVENIIARHGQLNAVRGVSLSVAKGEVLGVVGANGAGKTTLFRTISGVHKASEGAVRLNGEDITSLSPFKRVQAGIAMVPEGRRLFVEMTVKENLQIGGENGRDGPWTLDAVMEALPTLKQILDMRADALSGGQRQTVAIGRALMANPSVLLLDEVSLGLSPVAVEGLYESLNGLRAAGETTMIVVEQDLDRAMSFSDRLICLLEGEITLSGASDDLTKDAITGAYFGLGETGAAHA